MFVKCDVCSIGCELLNESEGLSTTGLLEFIWLTRAEAQPIPKERKAAHTTPSQSQTMPQHNKSMEAGGPLRSAHKRLGGLLRVDDVRVAG